RSPVDGWSSTGRADSACWEYTTDPGGPARQVTGAGQKAALAARADARLELLYGSAMRFDATAFEQHLVHERGLVRGGESASSSALRETLRLGAPLLHYDEIGSTNDEALSAARDGAAHGSLFVAEAQSAGRGRRGRSWSSRPGEDLLVSVLLRPNLAPTTASRLTLAVGLALRDGVARWLAEAPRIKW